MVDPEVHSDTQQSWRARPGNAIVHAIVEELNDLRERIDLLQAELGRVRPVDAPAASMPAADPRAASTGPPSSSRRHLLHLAGASLVGAAGGAVVVGRPVGAADPNDVVKGISNPVDDTTTLDGAFPGPVLSLFNRSGDPNAQGLYVISEVSRRRSAWTMPARRPMPSPLPVVRPPVAIFTPPDRVG